MAVNYTQLKRRMLRMIHRRMLFRGGDRVAVGVSGGKDSSLLLRCLADLRVSVRGGFELMAIRVVDIDSPCAQREGIESFRAWCDALAVPLEVVQPPPEMYEGGNPCFRCAWRRREMLFKTAYHHGFRILALGHTAFDRAVTALLNLTLHGVLETMPEKLDFFQGKMTLIRPLALVTEEDVIAVSKTLSIPPPVSSCAYEAGFTRREMEGFLRRMLANNPAVISNILKASRCWESPGFLTSNQDS